MRKLDLRDVSYRQIVFLKALEKRGPFRDSIFVFLCKRLEITSLTTTWFVIVLKDLGLLSGLK